MLIDPSQVSNSPQDGSSQDSSDSFPGIVRNLHDLIDEGCRYSTIYADPPWPYRSSLPRPVTNRLSQQRGTHKRVFLFLSGDDHLR